MANELQGKRVAFLAAEMFEQVELTEPWQAKNEPSLDTSSARHWTCPGRPRVEHAGQSESAQAS